MDKRLDVYIVTYNRLEMLEKAIKAVIDQTYKDFNLYILDNASTVNVESLAKSFNDDRISYIRHKENIGGLENIKYAFNHCDSDYIIVLHDDDIVDEKLIEIELNVLMNDENIIAVSCNADIIDEEDKVVGSYEYDNSSEEINIVNSYFLNYLKTGKTLVFPATMYNNKLLRKYNVKIDDKVGPCADVIFHADLEKTGKKLVVLNKHFIKYRRHALQDSSINTITMLISLYKYIINNQYYSQFVINDRKIQYGLFNYLSHIIMSKCLYGYLNFDKSMLYLNEAKSILCHKKLSLIIYKFIILIICRFRTISWFLFKIHKKIRK